jgi:hypothetical protein
MGNGGERVWGGRNLIVTFEANGLVQHVEVCGDWHLVGILPGILRSQSSAERSGRLVVNVLRPGAGIKTLVIGTDAMLFGDDEIQRAQVKKIRFPGLPYTKSGRPDPSQIAFSLWLRRKLHGTTEIDLIATLPVLVEISQFLNAPTEKPITH